MQLVEMVANSHQSPGKLDKSIPLRLLTEAVESDLCRLVHLNEAKARQVAYDMARSRSEFVRNMAASPLCVLLEVQNEVGDKRRETTADFLVGILRDQELVQPGELHGGQQAITYLVDEWWLDPELRTIFIRELRRTLC